MESSHQPYLVIILFLLCIILGMGGLIFYLALSYFKNRMEIQTIKQPEIATSATKSRDSKRESSPEGTCTYHPELAATNMCAVCAVLLCQECNREYEHLHFCPRHFELYTSHKWKPLTTIVTRSHSPEKGIALQQFKEQIWETENIPSFVVTHYKIDVETDEIESYIQLYVREEEYEQLIKRLNKHESPDKATYS